MAKFTSGPWQHNDYRVFGRDHDGRLFTIASCAWNQRSRTPEAKANTRLIAAAPELYAALLEAREELRQDYPDYSLACGYWPDMKPIVERWDALIARINGVEP